MDKSHTQVSHERLLLNAESFGFGPSAAVASIFPHVRERFDHIAYVGTGHSLDIQKGLAYDSMYDLSELNTPERSQMIKNLAEDYDLFFTAMDFPLLEQFHAAGMKTAGYDALAWYWPSLPEGVAKSDLYLAQNFFGVRDRVESMAATLRAFEIVPPMIPEAEPRKERSHILVNMGGLQNPFWTVSDAVLYAKKVTAALQRVLPSDEDIKIATSAAIAEKIGSGARVYAREEMKELLCESRFAFMTPGLGNIYDAAVYDIPTIWLPPANDSQGQQVTLLQREDMTDASVDWSQTMEHPSMNYWEDQAAVLKDITAYVHKVSVDELEVLFAERLMILDEEQPSKTKALIQRFGTRGDRVVAERLHAFSLVNEANDGVRRYA